MQSVGADQRFTFCQVAIAQWNLKARVLCGYAHRVHQRGIAVDFGRRIRPVDESAVAPCFTDLYKSCIGACAHLPDNIVHYSTAAVHLNGEIETTLAHVLPKGVDMFICLRLLGKSDCAGKDNQFIDEMRIAVDETSRPRKADQGYVSFRFRPTQRAQRWHGA